MSISKYEFNCALREVINEDYSFIPCSEENVNLEFSNNFKIEIMNIKRIKRKQNNRIYINTSRRFAVVLIIILLLLITTVCVQAYKIIKQKSLFQDAFEKDIPISYVDIGEDLKFTEFDNASPVIESDTLTDNITNEIFADPKIDIYNKMLNSIDNFNSVSMTIKTSMLYNDVTVIEYNTNIDEVTAYEAVYSNGKVIEETYSVNENMTYINHKNKTYNRNYLGVYKRSDTPYIPLSERITIMEEDGMPCYSYRRNVTNCPLASYCLVPQEFTFSYLKNFDKWEITEKDIILFERKCVKISGKPSAYISNKHNNTDFTMIVDTATGILLQFEGFKNGKITDYIYTTELSFNEQPVKTLNIDEYKNYIEINR